MLTYVYRISVHVTLFVFRRMAPDHSNNAECGLVVAGSYVLVNHIFFPSCLQIMLLETSRRYNPALESITFLKDFSYNKDDFAKAGQEYIYVTIWGWTFEFNLQPHFLYDGKEEGYCINVCVADSQSASEMLSVARAIASALLWPLYYRYRMWRSLKIWIQNVQQRVDL